MLHRRRLEMVSRNLAAAIRDADAPCFVNTALYPPSSFTLIPFLQRDSPFLCLEMLRKLREFQVAEVHEDPAWQTFQLVPLFVGCGFGVRNDRRIFHGYGLCTIT